MPTDSFKPMAHLSTSPSGSSRRLSELLEEQQEPFSLDLYLLDRGCSPIPFDTSACWPKSRGTSSALRRMVASKKTPPASGLLRLLLSKILHRTAAVAAKKKKLQPAAMDCSPVDVQKTPSCIKNTVLYPPPRAVQADRNEAGEEEEYNVDNDDGDDDDSSKQLSPISVLEQSPFEQAPKACAQTVAAMVIFRELMEAACNPALLGGLAKDSSNSKSKHGRNETSTTTAVPAAAPARTGRTTGAAAHWEEMFEAEELAKEHDLIVSDMDGAKVWPGDVRPEQWDVGSDVAVAVLEALTEEIAVGLLSRRGC